MSDSKVTVIGKKRKEYWPVRQVTVISVHLPSKKVGVSDKEVYAADLKILAWRESE